MSSTATPRLVVAIPAHDEAERIQGCLAALCVQRDAVGAPLPASAFEVVVYANNCRDDTAAVARTFAARAPHAITVVEGTLAPDQAHAGWARRRAMDLAADRLDDAGFILTTDADTLVAPDWVDATRTAFAAGADAVAGFLDGDPAETMRLAPAFVARAKLEAAYARLMAEIAALGDPRPHDPWPNHRIASGATLAVTLRAYRALGGLTPAPHAEDVIFAEQLEAAGFAVRHSLAVRVSTSWRLDGRAMAGTAAVLRHRQNDLDGVCEDDQEPARAAVRRAVWKGRLRTAHAGGMRHADALAIRLDLPASVLHETCSRGFEGVWGRVCEASPLLGRQPLLRPSDLPREAAVAERALRLMRRVRRV